jgi:ABC-type transport system involved in multi-copper enzyme maturation permease subunit
MKLAFIALNTFRESVRDRILYNLVVFALLLIGSSLFIGELAIGGEQKIIVDLGLSAMRFFGTLIAIFIGIQLVYKEIERRTLYNVLSKPVRRGEFILGKYLGLGLTLGVNAAVMVVGIVLTLLMLERGLSNLVVPVLPAAFLIFLELLVVTAVALSFSTFSTPALSAILTFLVWITGHFTTNFKDMAAASDSPVVSTVLYTLYYAVPNFSNFNAIAAAGHGDVVSAARVAGAVAYAVVYCGILLSVAVLAFERREFK